MRHAPPPQLVGEAVGRTVGDVRRSAGLTQEELADLAGVAPRTIRRYEGGRPPSLSHVVGLARALQVPPGRLLRILDDIG